MVLLRLIRLYRRIRGRRSIGVAGVLLLVAVCILGNAVCFLVFDGPLRPDLGPGDALWYSVVSITTIGYGDLSAQSFGARLGTFLFIMVLGLATFSVCLGMGIDWVSDQILRGQRGMTNILAKNHLLIVNFPSEQRVASLIQELQSDPYYRGQEVVLVSDEIETLPLIEENLLFVRGSILDQDTYLRARLQDAAKVIVLATSYTDPRSDALVASAVAVINSLNPNADIVAECLDPKHRLLFDSVHCGAVVFTMQVTGNLLVQEAQDPGVSQLVEVITSNRQGTTLYSATVIEDRDGPTYGQLAKQLLDQDINVVSVNRGKECFTSFLSLKPRAGDRVIYAADRRHDWPDMLQAATAATGRGER
jgi:voltage-gated potassium channel